MSKKANSSSGRSSIRGVPVQQDLGQLQALRGRAAVGWVLLAIGCAAMLSLTGCEAGMEDAEVAWMRELPRVAAPSEWQPATRVWATVPIGDPDPGDGAAKAETGGPSLAELGIYRWLPDEAERPGHSVLLDELGRRLEIPTALLHAAEPASGPVPEPGSPVLAYHRRAGPILARLDGTEPLTVSFDWNGRTVQDAAVALSGWGSAGDWDQGLPQPAWVKADADWTAGLVVATDGEWAWVLDEARRVRRLPKEQLAPRALWADPEPGSEPLVYSWAEGLRPATVVEVLEPGLRYRVRLHGAGPASREDGALEDATLEDGTLEDGTLEDGTLEDGTLEDGTLEDGTLEDGGTAEQSTLIEAGDSDGGSLRVVSFDALVMPPAQASETDGP